MASVTKGMKLMGNMFALHAIHREASACTKAIELAIAEIQRIEKMLTN